MNWILAIVAAMFGAAFAEEENLFGAICAFFLVMLGFALQKQRAELSRLRNEVDLIRRRASAEPAAPRAEPVAPVREAAPSAAASAAVPPATPATPAPASQAPESPAPSPAAGDTGPMPPPRPDRAPSGAPSPTFEPAAAREPLPPPRPRAPAEPGWDAVLVDKVKRWFTEGNVPVKIGVLVLLFGVAAALRLAVANGYLMLPIEARLAIISVFALLGLGLGWRERLAKPAFALSLQGGALGVLLLVVFAAFKLYGLLPAGMALGLVVVLVAGAALLAVLQDAMALAVLGFLGGYLAPVLISTGSGNHVALFSYYAVLNAAVFAISWKRSWRLLNLIGFFFTFGVGAAWGAKFYRPELFATVEPFLVLFFAFYLLIGLAYVLRQTEHRRPWVDGTLVFGTPLVAFPLQAGMLKDDRMALAFSAVAVALVYVGLIAYLRRRRGERLLTEAYGALALGFATLAVPMAFSAGTTASLWALEGAGAAWLGLRQGRKFPWLAGLALQLLAAGSYLLSTAPHSPAFDSGWLLLNSQWLGAAIIAFSGFALSCIHDRHAPRFGLPALLFAWAVLWWFVATALQLDDAELTVLGDFRFAAVALGASAALAAVLSRWLAWPRLEAMSAVVAVLGFLLVPFAVYRHDAPLALPTLGAWAAYAAGLLFALHAARDRRDHAQPVAHVAWLWTVGLTLSLQAYTVADDEALAEGWRFLAWVAPIGLMTLGLWRRPQWLAWPRAEAFRAYEAAWFAPAMLALACAFIGGLFLAGDATPLAYVPVLNPLELALLGIGVLLFALAGRSAQLSPLRAAWPVPALALVTMATLRGVHHWHGEPWSAQMLDSGFSQASLTVVWSLIGVSAWILGSRRRDRVVWTGGAVLMGIVLLKLLAVDRSYMGNLPGIVSFMAVGLLLVGVGWIAPSPPRTASNEAPA